MEKEMSGNVSLEPTLSNKLVVTRKSEVPEYLRKGDFYQSLNEEDDELISVPSNTLKPNATVQNDDDMEYLLTSLRFWAVEQILQEVVVYCLDKDSTSCTSVLDSFKKDFQYVEIVLRMILLDDEERAELAINSGELNLVKILHEPCCALSDGCHIAARAGQLYILQYLHQHGGRLDSPASYNSAYDCGSVCAHAAGGGSLACLQYAHEQGCPCDETVVYYAVCKGHTACVEYALQNCPIITERPCCLVAVEKGFLNILKLLHAAGALWDEFICSNAAYFGNLHCLQYAHESGCPWNVYTCHKAAAEGRLDCLRYAHENGCEWGDDTCYNAAKNGHIECLQYAHENGCAWNVCTTMAALRSDNLQCLEYALDNGCPLSYREACEFSTENGPTVCEVYIWDYITAQM